MSATKSPPRRLEVVKAKTPRRGKQNVDSTQARLNEQTAIDLRLAGHTYREIGETLGVSHKTAEEYVERVLSFSAAQLESVETVRQLELERLDKMQERLWRKALAGDHGADYLILKIQDRRARYLGLDAPVRQEVSGPGGGPIEVSLSAREALVDQLELRAGRAEK